MHFRFANWKFVIWRKKLSEKEVTCDYFAAYQNWCVKIYRLNCTFYGHDIKCYHCIVIKFNITYNIITIFSISVKTYFNTRVLIDSITITSYFSSSAISFSSTKSEYNKRFCKSRILFDNPVTIEIIIKMILMYYIHLLLYLELL